MTGSGLISQALGLQASYLVLNGKAKDILTMEIDRKVLIHTGLRQSSIIILSFAVEIALRALLKFKFDDFPRTHDYRILFKRLNEHDRSRLSEIYKGKTGSDITHYLNRKKNTFMAFGYLETGIDEPVNSDELNTVLDSIIECYNQLESNA